MCIWSERKNLLPVNETSVKLLILLGVAAMFVWNWPECVWFLFLVMSRDGIEPVCFEVTCALCNPRFLISTWAIKLRMLVRRSQKTKECALSQLIAFNNWVRFHLIRFVRFDQCQFLRIRVEMVATKNSQTRKQPHSRWDAWDGFVDDPDDWLLRKH